MLTSNKIYGNKRLRTHQRAEIDKQARRGPTKEEKRKKKCRERRNGKRKKKWRERERERGGEIEE